MAYDYAASVQGVAIRVTTLNDDGVLIPAESYTSKSFIRVSFTPEYEEGDEITEKNADGTICVTYKAPDTLKRATMEVAICDPDPILSSLMSGGVLLAGSPNPDDASPDASEPLGWASAQVGEDPSGNGVAVEVWSRAILEGGDARPNKYFHWVFPQVKARLSGDRVIENGLLATTFEGFGVGNSGFGGGPDATGDTAWRWPEVTDRPYMYARTSSFPNVTDRGLWNWTTGSAVTVDPLAGDTTEGPDDGVYDADFAAG